MTDGQTLRTHGDDEVVNHHPGIVHRGVKGDILEGDMLVVAGIGGKVGNHIAIVDIAERVDRHKGGAEAVGQRADCADHQSRVLVSKGHLELQHQGIDRHVDSGQSHNRLIMHQEHHIGVAVVAIDLRQDGVFAIDSGGGVDHPAVRHDVGQRTA